MAQWTKRITVLAIFFALIGSVGYVVSEAAAMILAGILLILVAWSPTGIFLDEEKSSYEPVLPSLVGGLLLVGGLEELGIWLPRVYFGILLILGIVAVYKLVSRFRRDQSKSPGQ